MKFIYIITVLALLFLPQATYAKTYSLQTMIEHALDNSFETSRIEKNKAVTEAEAFEIEVFENPNAEMNVTVFEENSSHSLEMEIEQPMRASHFGSRKSYAHALRRTAAIEEKAQKLELVHAITRSYASYWALQEHENLLSQNVEYARHKQKLIEQASNEGRIDAADAKIFRAEALRLEEQLRIVRAQKIKGAANLLRMAGMDQTLFDATRPKSPQIPILSDLVAQKDHLGSVRSLLESRKAMAENRYAVASQDAGFPEFAPRAVLERDFDENSTSILFGVSIAVPIWDRNDAELSRARAELRLAQTSLNALNEHNYANILAGAYEQAKATQISASIYRNKIVPSWREVQEIADEKFENGQASILELFQMNERVTEIQSEAIKTYLNSIEARIELEALIGYSLSGVKE